MSKIDMKLCRICLKSEKEVNVYDSSSYNTFFFSFVGVKDLPLGLWLCNWCKTAVKRTIDLIALAKQSQILLENCSEVDIMNKPTTSVYNLSCHNINCTEILSDEEIISLHNVDKETIEFCEPKTDTAKEFAENDVYKTDKEFHCLNEPLKKGTNCKYKEISKNELNYEDMKFKVKCLNVKQQIEEIEVKRNSEKYKSMKYQCKKCGIGFLTADVYEEHSMRHKEDAGPHECQTCHLRFKSKEVLSQHTLAHRRRFTCLICDAVFNRWRHCALHRYKCGGLQSPAVCRLCKKIFSNDHTLQVHIKGVHKKEKKYACEQCGRQFASKQRLIVHIRTHTGVKQFACSLCSRTFATNSNLRAHSSVHSDTRKHYCVECNTFYKTQKGLKRHFVESVKHSVQENLTYSCTECAKKFSTEKALNSHMNIRHLTTYPCSFCNKTFSNNANLRKHIRCIHVNESKIKI